MHKLSLLLLAAGLAAGISLGTASSASAIDFNVKGQWIASFDYGQNGSFTGGNGRTGYNNREDTFSARQRQRIQVDAKASETLSGTLFFEIGDVVWGQANTGGALGADGRIIEIKNAYLDWTVPDTNIKVRMGIQGLGAPSFALKKPQSFGDDVAGVAVSCQFNDTVGATAFWARPYNDNYAGNGNGRIGYMDNVDIGALMIPLTFDGFKLTPWIMGGGIGPNFLRQNAQLFGNRDTGVSRPFVVAGMVPAWGVVGSDGRTMDQCKINQYATVWWAGFTGDITYWDPVHVAFDFTAGKVDWSNSRLNRAGWMVNFVAEYKLDWGVPGLVGWYASGDDDDLGNGSERLPTLSAGAADNDFSRYAFDGNPWFHREGTLGNSMAGTWGIGLRIRDISFLEDLKHTFRLTYMGGTNDRGILKKMHRQGFRPASNSQGDVVHAGVENLYLTDIDSVMEIGLYNEYKMYENFKIVLDANYLAVFLSNDSSTWKRTPMNGASRDVRDAWNVNLSFAYEF